MSYGFSVREAGEGMQVPFRVLEHSNEVACHLNADLEIVYCNPAWDQFALANDGDSAVFEQVRNTPVMKVVPEVLQEFYAAVFKAAETAIVEFDYECSSPQLLRRFRMQILPNTLFGGLTVLNSLLIEEPVESTRECVAPTKHGYVRASGLIEVCSHCRRSRRVQSAESWDWVPAHLDRSLSNLSHGLCPICHAYFYGPR